VRLRRDGVQPPSVGTSRQGEPRVSSHHAATSPCNRAALGGPGRNPDRGGDRRPGRRARAERERRATAV